MMSRTSLILNFVLFQLGWFACVLGGANNYPLFGTSVAILIVIVHLWSAREVMPEAKLLTLALLVGLVFESLLVNLGLTAYNSGMLLPVLAPPWMIMLWPLFATTLNASMRWIKQLAPWLVALLGAVLAPIAYFAGARLQAVVFDNPTLSLAAIALGWALLLPILVAVARHLDAYDASKTALTYPRSQADV